MKEIINALGGILSAVLSGTLSFLVEIVDLIGKKSHDVNATFGKQKKVFSYAENCSLYIGNKAIDQHIAMNSTLVIGRTGSGKSSSVFKSSLLQTPNPKIKGDASPSMSYVVLDPPKELELDSAGYNSEKGYITDILSFSESSLSTVSWNPIAGLSGSGVTRFASEFVETVLRNSGSNDPFWGLSAARVIAFSIDLVRFFGKRYTNLYNVRHVVQTLSANKVLFNAVLSIEKIPNELHNRYSSIINMGSKLLASVLATTMACLEIFNDPNIVRVTSSSSLDMDSYRHESRILYIQTPVLNQEYVSVLNTLLFSSFFSHCMSAIPEDADNTIGFMIDECSSLKLKPSLLPLACSNLRKHRAYGVFGFQSLTQIEELYGQQNARTINQNVGTKLFFSHQNLQTSQELSQLLGRYTYSEDGQKKTRSLLTPDEVSFLDHPEGGLLFSGSERGILLKKIQPFFKNRNLLKRSEIETPEREYISQAMPPLLSFENILEEDNEA